ncbi:MAG TPA: hypothetical protein VFT12_10715, partial [Thermoanaerobaculia bacterium]|nr:hypothetical protein [Thermoanaerobaculia bacterium]
MRVRPCIDSVEDRIDLIAQRGRKEGGVSVATVVSILVHVGLLILFIRAHKPAPEIKATESGIQFVHLLRSNPREFVEAPGPAIPSAPINAPYSDANRRASIPEPTGDQPTTRPGDGSDIYTPPMGSAATTREPQPPSDTLREADRGMTDPSDIQGSPVEAATMENSSRIPPLRTEASLLDGGVNWRSAIKEVGKMASIAGTEGFDLSGVAGGEKGFAEAGPLSFETQWYDWGDYAQSMVSKIRVNWYNQMPQLIRTGLHG